jgi:hypothetical protein
MYATVREHEGKSAVPIMHSTTSHGCCVITYALLCVAVPNCAWNAHALILDTVAGALPC